MTPEKRQARAPDSDPKTGLTPLAIAGALTAGAVVWFIIELIQRGL